MIATRSKSPVLLLTLAEFAWLSVFLLLLLLRGREDEGKALKGQVDAARLSAAGLQEKFKNGLSAIEVAEDSRKKAEQRAADAAAQLESLREKLGAIEPAQSRFSEVESELKRQIAAEQSETNKLRAELEKVPKNLPEILTLIEQLKSQRPAEAVVSMGAAGESERDRKGQAAARALAEIASRDKAEFSIRQELIGIKAQDLMKVVILFDTSASMRDSTAWEDAKRLVRTWLTHLPIEECVLINFASKVHVFPEKGYLRLRNPDKTLVEKNQSLLLQHFESMKFESQTNTLAALQAGYEFTDVNMILLFTDGEPRTWFRDYGNLKPKIFDLVKSQKRKIPINAIGLGDYETLDDEDIAAHVNRKIQFLKELARETGGNFMAR